MTRRDLSTEGRRTLTNRTSSPRMLHWTLASRRSYRGQLLPRTSGEWATSTGPMRRSQTHSGACASGSSRSATQADGFVEGAVAMPVDLSSQGRQSQCEHRDRPDGGAGGDAVGVSPQRFSGRHDSSSCVVSRGATHMSQGWCRCLGTGSAWRASGGPRCWGHAVLGSRRHTTRG